MYFQAAEVGADFRLLPQKCTESYLQFAQFAQPPLDVAIEVQIHGQHQQIEMRWYAQIHITIHKKWEDTALWVDDQKNTQVMLESRQTSTDGRSTSRRTGATSWCFYLLGDDHPDHPGTYRVRSSRKKEKSKTVLMGRGWKQTGGVRFSGCQRVIVVDLEAQEGKLVANFRLNQVEKTISLWNLVCIIKNRFTFLISFWMTLCDHQLYPLIVILGWQSVIEQYDADDEARIELTINTQLLKVWIRRF